MTEEERSLVEALQGFNELLSERDKYRHALENIRLFAGKHRREPWASDLKRLIDDSGLPRFTSR